MGKKTGVYRALSFVMAFVLSLSVIMGIMLERFRQQVDETLGTTSQVVVSDGEGNAWKAFTPPEELRREDGTMDTKVQGR